MVSLVLVEYVEWSPVIAVVLIREEGPCCPKGIGEGVDIEVSLEDTECCIGSLRECARSTLRTDVPLP